MAKFILVYLKIDQETEALEIVEPGELAFLPARMLFYIFCCPIFGITATIHGACIPISVFGKLKGSIYNLRKVYSGTEILVAAL
jgi:hypothetical protein